MAPRKTSRLQPLKFKATTDLLDVAPSPPRRPEGQDGQDDDQGGGVRNDRGQQAADGVQYPATDQ